MTQTLKLGFKNEAAKDVNILLPNPKANLTKVEAVAIQTMIIARNLLTSTGGDPVSALDPVILTQDTAALA